MFRTYSTGYCTWCQAAGHSAGQCAREHAHNYSTPHWGHPTSTCKSCGDTVSNDWGM